MNRQAASNDAWILVVNAVAAGANMARTVVAFGGAKFELVAATAAAIFHESVFESAKSIEAEYNRWDCLFVMAAAEEKVKKWLKSSLQPLKSGPNLGEKKAINDLETG